MPYLVRAALEAEVRSLLVLHCGTNRPAVQLPPAIGVLRSSLAGDLAFQQLNAASDYRWLQDRAVQALTGVEP